MSMAVKYEYCDLGIRVDQLLYAPVVWGVDMMMNSLQLVLLTNVHASTHVIQRFTLLTMKGSAMLI